MNTVKAYNAGDVNGISWGIMSGALYIGAWFLNITAFNKALIWAHPIYEIINRKPKIDLDEHSDKEFKAIDSDINFNNVSFQYKSRPNKVLDGVSLTIENGKLTAFVGPSGSGKSTMAKLMMRLYDPDEGSITVWDTPLTDINLRKYRHRVGYVGQEPCLFHESIKNNLLNANPKATDANIEHALKTAMAYDFVNKLEGGIDADAGAIGGHLSGGQKQRIAIARALINKPDLLVFDEATSALDTENERRVQAAIDKVNEELEVTRVVIAHRLSTIQNADKIVMFDSGRIVDQGTHEELLQTNEKYRRDISNIEKDDKDINNVCSVSIFSFFNKKKLDIYINR